MKKVLIICHLSPRWGSFRPPRLAKYLPEFGWQPIILTGPVSEEQNPQLRIVETPYRDALAFWKRLLRLNPEEGVVKQVRQRFGVTSSKRSFVDVLLRFAGEVLSYPDLYRGWKPFALKAGSELLEREEIAAIISCQPVISHLIAAELKVRYKIPWIVDFTDLWSQNHYYPYGPLRKLLDTRLEARTLSQVDALITISQPWAEKLRTLHKEKPVYVISHGFEPMGVNTPPANLTAKFSITYTGSIYPGKQNPSKLFSALQDLVSNVTINTDRVEVRFYGPQIGWLDKEIEQYGLSRIVKQYGRVPEVIALQRQRESQILLLLDWDDPKEKGVYTSKVFEYLGAKRPILATGGSADDVVAQLLNETKAGRHAPSVEDIKDTLKELYQEYELRGEVTYKGVESEVDKYSYHEVAREFAEIMDRLA